MSEKLFFKAIKEARDGYFVEYHPPSADALFATLSVIFPQRKELIDIASVMELEAKAWLNRFPIPVMVSAFDEARDLVQLDGARPCAHVFAYSSNDRPELQLHWRLLKNDEIPLVALDREYLLKIYSGIDRTTSSELRDRAVRDAKQRRIDFRIIYFWAAILPAIVLVLEFLAPTWLGAIILCFSLWKAWGHAMELLGKNKKAPDQIAKDDDARLMQHHHYYCRRNPEGFRRLMAEAIEEETKSAIQNEFRQLTGSNGKPST